MGEIFFLKKWKSGSSSLRPLPSPVRLCRLWRVLAGLADRVGGGGARREEEEQEGICPKKEERKRTLCHSHRSACGTTPPRPFPTHIHSIKSITVVFFFQSVVLTSGGFQHRKLLHLNDFERHCLSVPAKEEEFYYIYFLHIFYVTDIFYIQ